MDDSREDLAVLGKRSDGLHGDPGVALGLGQHEHERRASFPDEVERRPQRPEVVRARPRRNQDEVGEPEQLPVLVGQGRWRVDEAVDEPHRRQRLELRRHLADVPGRELRPGRLPRPPPGREGLLGVRVDHDGRPVARALGGDGEMGDQRRLSAPALLAGDYDGLHFSMRLFREV